MQYLFDCDFDSLQIVSAKDSNAYPGIVMHRTMILMQDEHFRKPLVIDIFKLSAATQNQYDLPLWFMGHLLSTSFEYEKNMTTLTTLGNDYGYQHLWKEASRRSDGKSAQITWYVHGKFYTMNCATEKDDELIFVKPGANDPNFNLRYDPGFIHRKENKKDALFASVIESHGRYNPVSEIALDPFSGIEKIEILYDAKEYTVIKITSNSQKTWTIGISNEDPMKESIHHLKIGNVDMNWKGPYFLKKN